MDCDMYVGKLPAEREQLEAMGNVGVLTTLMKCSTLRQSNDNTSPTHALLNSVLFLFQIWNPLFDNVLPWQWLSLFYPSMKPFLQPSPPPTKDNSLAYEMVLLSSLEINALDNAYPLTQGLKNLWYIRRHLTLGAFDMLAEYNYLMEDFDYAKCFCRLI